MLAAATWKNLELKIIKTFVQKRIFEMFLIEIGLIK